MTDKDKKSFAAAMTWLGEYYEKDVSKQKMADYFDGLTDFDVDSVLWSIKESVKRYTFFPKIKELRDTVSEKPRKQIYFTREERALMLPEETTDPETARRNLNKIFSELNGKFGTSLKA